LKNQETDRWNASLIKVRAFRARLKLRKQFAKVLQEEFDETRLLETSGRHGPVGSGGAGARNAIRASTPAGRDWQALREARRRCRGRGCCVGLACAGLIMLLSLAMNFQSMKEGDPGPGPSPIQPFA